MASSILNRYLGTGTLSERPVAPDIAPDSAAFYTTTDTDQVFSWNGTEWVEFTGGSGGSGAVDSVNGQTGVVVLDKGDIGLGDVDNTSDLDKPISTETQNALNDLTSLVDDLDGAVSSKIGQVQDDIAPVLGGNLLVNGKEIRSSNTTDRSTVALEDHSMNLTLVDGTGISINDTTGISLSVPDYLNIGLQTGVGGQISFDASAITIGTSTGIYIDQYASTIGFSGVINTELFFQGDGLIAGGDDIILRGGAAKNVKINTSTDQYSLPNTRGTTGQYLKVNGTGTTAWATIAYSDVSGTPSLATVATTGAYNDLTGKPSLATVATSGSYADLSNKPTFLSPRIGTPSWSSSMTLDWSLYDEIRITLGGNTTFTHSGAVDGQKCSLVLTQDGTGSRTATWGSEVKYGALITSITLSTTASKSDEIGFKKNGSNYRVMALNTGF